MGIPAFSLNILNQLVALTEARPVKMVALGYPDILVPEAALREYLGDEEFSGLKYRDDSADIAGWHGLSNSLDKIPDPHDLFRRMGVELSVIDLKEVRGGEIVCDLNVPISNDFKESFDIVFDGGTMEHCFNVAQAITNILNMTKINGHIFHSNPMTIINHGFYNFSPTFYYDFYVQNGHQMASPFMASWGTALKTKILNLDGLARPSETPINACVNVVAKKCHGDDPKFPTQSKYLNFPDLKNT